MANASLSIIIPLYNATQWLEQLEETLERQGIFSKDCPIPVEVILIDDGSTDDTLSRIKEIAARHEIIHILTQKNAGQGPARNLGLDSARMKYAYMMDADDILEPGTLLHYVEIIDRENAEIIRFCYDSPSESEIANLRSNAEPTSFANEKLTFCPGQEYIASTCGLWLRTSMCDTIYNLGFARKVGARFEPTVRTHEDDIYVWRLFMPATKAIISSKICYHYIQRSNSDSHERKSDHIIKRELSTPLFIKALNNLVFQTPSNSIQKEINYWLKQKCGYYLFTYWLMVLKLKALTYKQANEEIEHQTKDGIYPITEPYPSKHPDIYPSSLIMKVLHKLISKPTTLRILLRLRLN